jgi:hypothetical protein
MKQTAVIACLHLVSMPSILTAFNKHQQFPEEECQTAVSQNQRKPNMAKVDTYHLRLGIGRAI